MSNEMNTVRLVTVARFDHLYQAQLAVAQLEAAGIPCLLADEHMGGLNMIYTQALGGVKVKVPESRVTEAQTVLAHTDVTGDEEYGAPEGE